MCHSTLCRRSAGPFPVELCDVQSLVFLDLASNDITGKAMLDPATVFSAVCFILQILGPFPHQCSRLEQLEALNITQTNMQGKIKKA